MGHHTEAVLIHHVLGIIPVFLADEYIVQVTGGRQTHLYDWIRNLNSIFKKLNIGGKVRVLSIIGIPGDITTEMLHNSVPQKLQISSNMLLSH